MELIGSTIVRVGTLFVLALMVLGVLFRDELEWLPSVMITILGIAGGLMSFIGVIFSFHALYERWMAFAEILHTVVVTTLFGICYFIVVPLFYPIVHFLDPLGLRRRPDRKSFWIQRRRASFDAESARRMG